MSVCISPSERSRERLYGIRSLFAVISLYFSAVVGCQVFHHLFRLLLEILRANGFGKGT